MLLLKVHLGFSSLNVASMPFMQILKSIASPAKKTASNVDRNDSGQPYSCRTMLLLIPEKVQIFFED
ncbi:hypothetical protein ALC53_04593 [Atta colombica]|uniref:Uncharacterized protein n=1 Tax=Atta colombica TaxID=520822 RepID=A0A195BKV7_9HYME|nr:hypothetical protein ALC53_04593 [Atta colombica]